MVRFENGGVSPSWFLVFFELGPFPIANVFERIERREPLGDVSLTIFAHMNIDYRKREETPNSELDETVS